MKISTCCGLVAISHFLALVFGSGEYNQTLLVTMTIMTASALICLAIEDK